MHVTDFGKSWRDGVALGAIIHNIRPDLVDMDQFHKQEARINLEHAFDAAEKHLGIPRLLDPEGMLFQFVTWSRKIFYHFESIHLCVSLSYLLLINHHTKHIVASCRTATNPLHCLHFAEPPFVWCPSYAALCPS